MTPPTDRLIHRFEGRAGRRLLVEVLRANVPILQQDAAIARKVTTAATLHELAQGDILIRQDGADDDLFFVLCGAFRVIVNGHEIAERPVGQHIGEMAIVDPSSRRTATVVASAPSVVAKLKGSNFLTLANKDPRIWRATAQELCRA